VGNAAASARVAGYSEKSARELGRRLVDVPHIQAAIREANHRLISGRLVTKSVALLERIIDDESIHPKIRLDALKTALDRGGFAAAPARLDKPNEKHASEMTEAELYQRMIELRKIVDASQASAIIDVTPPTPALPVPVQKEENYG
jgi:hypothetical protein